MKKYEFLGGGLLEAASHLELAEAMRNTSHTPTESLQEFMEQTAYRCKIQRDSDIRTDSVDNFIEDLKKEGFVKEV
jgi:hypothetical protein